MAFGDSTIRARAGKSEIVVTTTARLAGAIHSLTWDGREFIDSVDHGRQLQSASNFDAGQPKIEAETFNPTEAGSRYDSAGPTSTSVLERLNASGRTLETTSLMAQWLRPGEKSGAHLARNPAALSRHRLAKRVTIGMPGWPQALRYDVSFEVPGDEGHRHGVFESLTGYMPAEFSVFLRFDAVIGKLVPLSDGPGELPDPVALATADGRHAMGIYSPDRFAETGWRGPTYGRFRFKAERVVKWNCVSRETKPQGLPAGVRKFRHAVLVGTRNDVEGMLAAFVKAGAANFE
jgi:hypothetical protein